MLTLYYGRFEYIIYFYPATPVYDCPSSTIPVSHAFSQTLPNLFVTAATLSDLRTSSCAPCQPLLLRVLWVELSWAANSLIYIYIPPIITSTAKPNQTDYDSLVLPFAGRNSSTPSVILFHSSYIRWEITTPLFSLSPPLLSFIYLISYPLFSDLLSLSACNSHYLVLAGWLGWSPQTNQSCWMCALLPGHSSYIFIVFTRSPCCNLAADVILYMLLGRFTFTCWKCWVTLHLL